MTCKCESWLPHYLAWSVPVGPEARLTRRFSVGTSAQTLDLSEWAGYRVAIIATNAIAASFGRRDQVLPDPNLSTGDDNAHPGGKLTSATYMEHAVIPGATDGMRIIADSASTDVTIYPISRPAEWWEEQLG